MAKSNSFFSIRRGSTKSHTYTGWQGQQVTKDRVVTVKNPRSAAQQEQRQKFAAVGNFYKYLKFILNHSWEGVSYGVNSYNKFMSINVKNFDKASMIIPEYGSKVAEAGEYQVSEGSLPTPESVVRKGNENFSFDMSVTDGTKIADALAAWFANGEDYITIVGLASTAEPDGSPNVNYQTKGFAIRLHKPTAAGDTAITAENFDTLFQTEYVNILKENLAVSVDGEGANAYLKVVSDGIYIQCFGAIASKADNGTSATLRSTTILTLPDAMRSLVAATNASNAESWPVGADYLLNGETVTPTKG